MNKLGLCILGAMMLAFAALIAFWPADPPKHQQISADYLYGCQQAAIGRPRYGPDGYYGDAWHPCPDANGNLTRVYPDPERKQY